MNTKLKVTGLAVAALLIGVGIGSAGGSTTTPEPAAKPAETITKTVTKEVTPESCFVALEHATELQSHASAFGNLAAKYVQLIPVAYQDGLLGNDPTFMDDMDRLNVKLYALKDKVDQSMSDYSPAFDECYGTSGNNS